MRPRPFRVQRKTRELHDTFSLELLAEDGRPFGFRPGQFTMLYLFGVGEVPISISGDTADPSKLVHTIRAVGPVTEAMRRLKPGHMLGVRGPFGTPWPVEPAEGMDVLVIAGGVGLAPLRPLIYRMMAERPRFGTVRILYGARSPEDILFEKELQDWRGRFDMSVHVTVDRATGNWSGRVGVVTKLIEQGGFDPDNTVAYLCGPEVMMRYSVKTLERMGVETGNMYVSMERNMKCAVGHCGHCQWGGNFVCKDGPVFRFADIADIFSLWEV